MPAPLQLEKMQAILASGNNKWLGKTGSLEVLPVTASTNTYALELISQGASSGTLVLARQQTSGRGRQGNEWHSPPDAGIYMSCIIRPKINMELWPLFTLATGVAVVRALESYAKISIGLKWVNDLVYKGFKLGGILAETKDKALVIGIGINVHFDTEDIPPELNQRMTCLSSIYKGNIDNNELCAEICRHLEDVFEMLESGKEETLLDEWRAYAVTLGQEVKVIFPNETICGRASDITNKGALIVDTENGTKTIYAGEVSIRKLDGSYS